MQYKSLRSIALILMALLVSVATVIAADGIDDQGNPNDPIVNERANACFEGGSLEDKCMTDWEWECGWHLIRLEEGIISEALFPSWCNSLIDDAPSEFPGCQLVNIVEEGSIYYDFGTSFTIPTPFNVYDDADCSSVAVVAGGNPGDTFAVAVFAPDDETAYARCEPFFDEPFFVAPERAPLNPFITACFPETEA